MEVFALNIKQLIVLAGIAQVVLAGASLAIPGILSWRTELKKVQPLIKQMFWTYAAYIFFINLFFGLLSTFDAAELINKTNLAMLLTGFIAAYWTSRVLIQFLYFDRRCFPVGGWYTFGELLLVALFVVLSLVYGYTCYLDAVLT